MTLTITVRRIGTRCAKGTEGGATIVCILDLTHEQTAALSVAAGREPIGELRVTPLLSLEEVNKAAETQRAWTGMARDPDQGQRSLTSRVAEKPRRAVTSS